LTPIGGSRPGNLFDDSGEDDDKSDEAEWVPLDADEILGELAPLLDALPTVWTGNGERQFMLFAWSALKTGGVVDYSTAREHVQVVATLAALHLLRNCFYVPSHEEGVDGVSWCTIGDLTGDFPKIDPFWLGVTVAHQAIDANLDPDDPSDSYQQMAAAWESLTLDRYEVVTDALMEAWGQNDPFCALWTSTHDEPVYPVPDAIATGILGMGDGTGPYDPVMAWHWLDDGMEPAERPSSNDW
jgi:hypothetical protein